jgi:DNA helicase II / ATP-dependent DNA helicase PcrA
MKFNNTENRILSIPFSVSDEQKDAILSDARYSRVVAGAGTGKTEVITRRITYLLLEKKVDPREIVAFSFTKKAAQNLKSRIYQRVEQIAGPEATGNLGDMYVGTIHGYAKQVLDDYFGYGNWTALNENQEVAFLMKMGWRIGIQKYDRFFANACLIFLRTVSMVQNELLDHALLREEAPDFFNQFERYWKYLEENKLLTFGRMISEIDIRLSEAPETLSHVKYLIVDEFQDINRAQDEFIRLIGAHGSIYIVGDPRQSIYQWRGSDKRFFDDFMTKYPGTESYNITSNRRSGKRIVINANCFSESFRDQKVPPMTHTRDMDGVIGNATFHTPQDEAIWIANNIQELVNGKKTVNYNDIGVLTRSIRTSAGELIDEFKKRGIPYIVGGKVGLFRRNEAQAMGMIFSWFSEKCFWAPNPWKWRERIEGDSLLVSALDSWEKAQHYGVPIEAEQQLIDIKDELYNTKSRFMNFSELYQEILQILGFHNLDFRDPKDAAIIANLGRFNNLLTDYETTSRIGGKTPKWQTELNGLFWFIHGFGLKAYEEQPSENIRNLNAVQLMTVHQAKGLEWPIVFLFSLTQNRFPPQVIGRQQQWCGIPRHLFDPIRYEGSIEDEKRLFYVAITRPRDALILSSFETMKKRVKKSSMLNNVDWTQIDCLDLSAPLSINTKSQENVYELQTFSASEIIQYNICPQLYFYKNICGYQPGLNPRIGYGKALHYCLRKAAEFVKKDSLTPFDAVNLGIKEGFHMPFIGEIVLKDFKRKGLWILINYVAKYGDDFTKIHELEYRIEFPTENTTILGRVDVILNNNDELEVRDYKTSISLDPEDNRTHTEAQFQVKLYSIALRNMGKNVTSGSIAYLDDPRIEYVDVDEIALSETKEIASKTVNNIRNKKFEPNSKENCGRCDYSMICKYS